jgi:hypothetical protein
LSGGLGGELLPVLVGDCGANEPRAALAPRPTWALSTRPSSLSSLLIGLLPRLISSRHPLIDKASIARHISREGRELAGPDAT